MKQGIGKEFCDQELFGVLMRESPYLVYQRLREDDPVHWNEKLQAWILTRYDDVALALNDPRLSSRRVAHARHRFADAEWDSLFETLASKMSEQDEPITNASGQWCEMPSCALPSSNGGHESSSD